MQKSVTLRTLIAVYLAFLTTIFAHYFGTDVTQFRRPPQSNGASVSRRGGSLGPHLFIANANSGLYVGYLLMYAFIIICSRRFFICLRMVSALRRVKTYLRATIGQTRLNSVLILNCHQERADSLSIAHDFICESDNRSNAFGNFV